ncbi:MAG: N-6 DNA methylase [Verrucomicrobiales bacterium]|jgi:methylase of polypeptide subunit release factors|nr:N-6 DNA methylase [Verrucomicrobiales bacterium]
MSFVKTLSDLAMHRGRSDTFASFCRLAACSLSVMTREPQYLEEAKRWKPDELKIFAEALAQLVMEMNNQPFADLLGPAWMDEAFGKRRAGEFYTPQDISDLMAQMTLGNPKEMFKGRAYVTFCEPACGSGTMILSAAKVLGFYRSRSLFTAIDISPIACDMTFINCTLWGIPCRILHGNALSNEYWAEYRTMFWPRDPDFVQGTPPPVPLREQLRRQLRGKGIDWKKINAIKKHYSKTA